MALPSSDVYFRKDWMNNQVIYKQVSEKEIFEIFFKSYRGDSTSVQGDFWCRPKLNWFP